MPQLTQKLTIISRDAQVYSALLAEMKLPGLEVTVSAQSAENIDLSAVELLLSEPNLAAPILNQCHQLKWMQSTWAGNAPLLQHAKTNYLLTGVKGIFGVAMREYVFAYMLYFERNIAEFMRPEPERTKPANWAPPSVGTLSGKKLGILGAGSIASELVDVARALGMQILGANRSGRNNANYDAIYSLDKLNEFAAKLDYLLCLLPDTPATKHIVNAELLAQLPSDCVVINAGRGSSIDDQALIAALNKQQLKAAVLDVFAQEPLPDEHPYWHMDKVFVTQHTAAISQPGAVIEVFAENYGRWCNQQPLKYPVDFTRGY